MLSYINYCNHKVRTVNKKDAKLLHSRGLDLMTTRSPLKDIEGGVSNQSLKNSSHA